MENLGQLEQTYYPPQGKKYLNYTLGIIFLLIGFVFVLALLQGSVIGIPGLFFVVLGGAFIYLTYTRSRGRMITLYEHGFRINESGQVTKSRFDQVVGWNILADSNVYVRDRTSSGITRPHYGIVGYEYLLEDGKKVVVDDRYSGWEAIADQLNKQCLSAVVSDHLQHLYNGTRLEFRQLQVGGSGMRDNQITLVMTSMGISMPHIKEYWTYDQITDAKQNILDSSQWEINVAAGINPPPKFRYYNYPNGPVIVALINAIKQQPK